MGLHSFIFNETIFLYKSLCDEKGYNELSEWTNKAKALSALIMGCS